MHYVLTEKAYNRLNSVYEQLGFVTSLAGDSTGHLGLVLASDLVSFLDAQREGLTEVITDAEFTRDEVRDEHQLRAQAERDMLYAMRGQLQTRVEASLKIGPKDWARALTIAAGNAEATGAEDIDLITFKLAAAADVDAEMQDVLTTWMAITTRKTNAGVPRPESTPSRGAKARKRAALVAG